MITEQWQAERIFSERINTSYFVALRRSDLAVMGRMYPGQPHNEPLTAFGDFTADFIESSLPIAPTTTGPFDGSMYGAYGVIESGNPTPVPPPVVLQGKDIKVNNKERWTRSPKTGEIVVSDYERLRILCTFQNGGVQTVHSTTYKGVGIGPIMAVMGIPKQTQNGKSFYDIGGEFLLEARGAVNIMYAHTTSTDSVTAYEDGFTLEPLKKFLENPESWLSDDFYIKVTETLAEANTGTLDILTSLAEMPETVKSIYDGLRFMLRGLVDVKKKQFSFLNKAKRVKREHERKVFRLEYDTRQQFLKARNDKTRRTIEAKAAQKRKQLANDLKNSLNALTTASAGVWLNYRYNIGPTVYMIEDAIDALFDKDKFFFRWRGRVLESLELPDINGFQKDGLATCMERVFIKRAFAKGLPLGQHLSASIFTTAWELIPLSFVLDWIVNVGDFIKTSSSNMLSKAYNEGSTLSLKVDGVVTYTGTSGSRVSCELGGYKRVKINPNDFCRLTINPDITGVRQIDALALSWNIFLKKTWKY